MTSGSHTQVGGIDTYVREAGTGDVPVVCLHGTPDAGDLWAPLLDRAGELGRVIAPDVPGWGQSPAPDRAVCDGSLDALDRWFEALLDTLQIDRFRLVVHDWGSLALSAASRRADRVERLVAIDLVPLSRRYKWHWISRFMWRPPVVGELTMPVFNRFTIKTLTRIQRPGFRPMSDEWLDRIASHLDSGTKDSILRLYRSADPMVLDRHGNRMRELRCPALVIWGEQDPYIGTEHVETVADALGGPVERWIVPGAGHWCMVDAPEVYDRIAGFLVGGG
jgi:pimeloyl-ACP methyl ester carboxylesterase